MHRRCVTLVVVVGGGPIMLLLLVMIGRVLLVRLLNGMRLRLLNRRLVLIRLRLLLLLLLLLPVRSPVMTAVVVVHRRMWYR